MSVFLHAFAYANVDHLKVNVIMCQSDSLSLSGGATRIRLGTVQ